MSFQLCGFDGCSLLPYWQGKKFFLVENTDTSLNGYCKAISEQASLKSSELVLSRPFLCTKVVCSSNELLYGD